MVRKQARSWRRWWAAAGAVGLIATAVRQLSSPVIADTMSNGILAVWTLSDNAWVQQDIT